MLLLTHIHLNQAANVFQACFTAQDALSFWRHLQYPPEQRMGAYEEEGRAMNHLKAGIITADRIVTVSPGG